MKDEERNKVIAVVEINHRQRQQQVVRSSGDAARPFFISGTAILGQWIVWTEKRKEKKKSKRSNEWDGAKWD